MSGSHRVGPELVDVHDFPDDAIGKAIPHGVYCLAANDGFVSVVVDRPLCVRCNFDRRLVEARPKRRYPNACEMFITADAGRINSYRLQVWKSQLQEGNVTLLLPIDRLAAPFNLGGAAESGDLD